MYITAVGYVLVRAGVYIESDYLDDERYINFFFAGGFLTTVFMVCMVTDQNT